MAFEMMCILTTRKNKGRTTQSNLQERFWGTTGRHQRSKGWVVSTAIHPRKEDTNLVKAIERTTQYMRREHASRAVQLVVPRRSCREGDCNNNNSPAKEWSCSSFRFGVGHIIRNHHYTRSSWETEK